MVELDEPRGVLDSNPTTYIAPLHLELGQWSHQRSATDLQAVSPNMILPTKSRRPRTPPPCRSYYESRLSPGDPYQLQESEEDGDAPRRRFQGGI
jgi:hypothetical protein